MSEKIYQENEIKKEIEKESIEEDVKKPRENLKIILIAFLIIGQTLGLIILGIQYIQLASSNQNFQNQYYDLQNQYYDLQKNLEIEQELCIGNSLESYYDLLRTNNAPEWDWWGSEYKYWQDSANFLALLGLHDLGRIYWINLENLYYDLIGEYSYKTASEKINTITELIDIPNLPSNTTKIEYVLDFISDHIIYQNEINEVFHSPVETLGFRSGDCDDFTILAATLFENLDIESAVGLFYNDNNEIHAMTLVNLNDLDDYGYYYYNDLTNYGLDSGRWIIIEPQSSISQQYTEWVLQWDLFAAAELDTADYV